MNPVRKQWNGAAAIVNQDDKLLMIKSKDAGTWSVPSCGIEAAESPEEHVFARLGRKQDFMFK